MGIDLVGLPPVGSAVFHIPYFQAERRWSTAASPADQAMRELFATFHREKKLPSDLADLLDFYIFAEYVGDPLLQSAIAGKIKQLAKTDPLNVIVQVVEKAESLPNPHIVLDGRFSALFIDILRPVAKEKQKEVFEAFSSHSLDDEFWQAVVGKLLEEGIGTTPNLSQAVALMQAAAAKNWPFALSTLAAYHEDGIGVVKDRVHAAGLYCLAAEQGDDEAQCNLGRCYEKGRGGVAKDETRAAELYRLAAEQGNPAAQHNLAVCYANGIGVAINKVLAVELYHLAAAQGLPDAQYNLGLCYANGIGVVMNKALATRYLSLAAEQGDSDAQAALACL